MKIFFIKVTKIFSFFLSNLLDNCLRLKSKIFFERLKSVLLNFKLKLVLISFHLVKSNKFSNF